MKYVTDIIDKAVDMTGSKELAEEMLAVIPFGANEDYAKQQMKIKYWNMCTNEIKAGQNVGIIGANGVFHIKDNVNGEESICIIHEDGKIEFFSKDVEYKNLAEYNAAIN